MKRLLPKLMLAAILLLMTVGAGTREDPALIYNTETIAIVFDDNYSMQNISIYRIDCDLLSDSGAPVTSWTVTSGWTMANGAVRLPVRSYASTLPNGLYQVRVRVWDIYGNISPWSEFLWVSKLWRDIPAPGGCRTVS